MKKVNIPRVVIAATQSSSGKTTVVTGILRALKNKGLNVQPYKVILILVIMVWRQEEKVIISIHGLLMKA